MKNRKYVIINTSSVTSEMLDNCFQSSTTMRKSLDGSKSLLSFECSTPSCFDGVTILDRKEVLETISNSDWWEDPS